jgi:hypothetical protein
MALREAVGVITKLMRVYHFINEEYGLDDLRRRRLKIATILELNDPFETLCD